MKNITLAEFKSNMKLMTIEQIVFELQQLYTGIEINTEMLKGMAKNKFFPSYMLSEYVLNLDDVCAHIDRNLNELADMKKEINEMKKYLGEDLT